MNTGPFCCRFCGSRRHSESGLCLGCGETVERAAAPPREPVDQQAPYCPTCRGNRVRKLRGDGFLVCVGCRSIFEPLEFVISNRDPSVAAEKDEEFELRKAHAIRMARR